ncbi:HPP family protein [Acinetobacter shaoyimingii]|uniref:HPP family protein n=1 Tax=Acinetobacter shaoyimingii TaxID=2715164 RepID=A0A6G8RVL7_9GAMM|nr:HPP family protein [Acinetobacter shaoyimingii]QIO05979.1 HPP family protein [Acinetobacter shaoyimingii]
MFSVLEGKEKLAQRPRFGELLRAFIGGTLSIGILLLLGKISNNPFIMAPFGATCVILYAVSQSPLAQPRNVIFDHLISAFVGILFLKLLGDSMWVIALSVGTAIALMQYFRCVHPPAGANPLVILLSASSVEYSWSFLIFPVLIGSVALVLVAMLLNNIKTSQKWPHYGLAVMHSKTSLVNTNEASHLQQK